MYCRALELDALKNSHPIEIPVGHPSEIDEIFDEISYDKGGSVIRMLHRYIGDEVRIIVHIEPSIFLIFTVIYIFIF